MKESDLDHLLRFSLGQHFPNRHRVTKHHADMYTGAGHPDFYGHILGRFVAIEDKVYPNRFSERQKTELTSWAESGAHAFGLLCWGEDFYLIPGLMMQAITYRNKQGWIPLPTHMSGTRLCLNLQILRTIIEVTK